MRTSLDNLIWLSENDLERQFEKDDPLSHAPSKLPCDYADPTELEMFGPRYIDQRYFLVQPKPEVVLFANKVLRYYVEREIERTSGSPSTIRKRCDQETETPPKAQIVNCHPAFFNELPPLPDEPDM